MGQFKPMVKMMTTEPTVELKLKKGGSVKKAMGGPMSGDQIPDIRSSMGSPLSMPARGGMAPAASPAKPSMAMRRKAMTGKKIPAVTGMKEGGKADMAQDKAMVKKAMKQHDAQEHKGGKGTKLSLKNGGMACATGGVVMGNAGGYAYGGGVQTSDVTTAKAGPTSGPTGGVKLGNAGGFKKGGAAKYAYGGGVQTSDVTTAKPGVTGTTTGDVKQGNAGGFKKGGATKKYARGGEVVQDDGKAVKMPQGQKKPSAPVQITSLAGTFKSGGAVR